ncbi:hypothetical protein CEXT_557571 [Caerostris extrusa]|uniref:ATP synthase F0 subunit 8 n=1 Tax=Caerostris extrusa TaxID=172846 RepID=A0AAV4PEU6_CAEEX|nr:hypothetical protein CEXT_557571 [Caerostris extrusa]
MNFHTDRSHLSPESISPYSLGQFSFLCSAVAVFYLSIKWPYCYVNVQTPLQQPSVDFSAPTTWSTRGGK